MNNFQRNGGNYNENDDIINDNGEGLNGDFNMPDDMSNDILDDQIPEELLRPTEEPEEFFQPEPEETPSNNVTNTIPNDVPNNIQNNVQEPIYNVVPDEIPDTTVEIEEESNSNPGGGFAQYGGDNGGTKNKNKKPLVVLGCILVLCILAFAVYAIMQTFVTPKARYAQIEAKNIKAMVDSVYNAYIEDSGYDMPVASKAKITAGIESQKDLDDEYIAKMNNALKKFDIQLTSASDIKNNKIQSDLSFNYDGDEITKISLMEDGAKFTLGLLDVFGKYISIDTSDLQTLFNNFGVEDTGIKRVVLPSELAPYTNISKSDADYISNRYSKVVLNAVPDDAVTFTKGIEITIDGKAYKTNKYTVNLNKITDSKIEILKELKKDNRTLGLICEKLGGIENLYEEAGYFISAIKNLEENVKLLENEVVKLENRVNSSNSQESVQYNKELLDSATKRLESAKNELYDLKNAKTILSNTENLKAYVDKMIERISNEEAKKNKETENETVIMMDAYEYKGNMIKRSFYEVDDKGEKKKIDDNTRSLTFVDYYDYDYEKGLNTKRIETKREYQNFYEPGTTTDTTVSEYKCISKSGSEEKYNATFTSNDYKIMNVDIVKNGKNIDMKLTVDIEKKGKYSINISSETTNPESVTLTEIQSSKELLLNKASEGQLNELYESAGNALSNFMTNKADVINKITTENTELFGGTMMDMPDDDIDPTEIDETDEDYEFDISDIDINDYEDLDEE